MELRKKKPMIAISPSICQRETIEYHSANGSFRNYTETAVLQSAYTNWIESAGGIPITIPVLKFTSQIHEFLESLDGVLLSGGEDLAPSFYHEAPINDYCKGDLRRTWYETAIIREAIKLNKPIFGICRGIQQLNVVLGGTLYQDIPIQIGYEINHSQSGVLYAHPVRVCWNKISKNIFEKDTFQTNSSHHQAIKDIGSNGITLAVTFDGVIEAMAWPQFNILGVQWHPERMDQDELSKKLASIFIDICTRQFSLW
ncbi:MAG: gamma-glutamyl-gamma-aminobutyrate hydrolase family protein [bacterium]|nr:gamma-glutamyl-gamma-aminobutyrate hydrolase family protein [bacterium]